MNLRKANSVIKDPSYKSEYNYLNELKIKIKNALNCIEAVPEHRSLLIIKGNGDTDMYTWNSCKHLYNCECVHNNRSQYGYITKEHAIIYITYDLYRDTQAEWKLI